MDYYFWVNGYENAGIVKAKSVEDARHKVIMSQGTCGSVSLVDDQEFDNYNVTVLIS